MHIVFANRYYSPDTSATSQIVSDLAVHLAGQGHRVEVICSRQLYENADAALASREDIAGVIVHRVATTRFGRATLIGRGLDYISFYLSFALACLLRLNKDSTLVCCTDPPLLSIVGRAVCLLRRAHQVNWLQDIYPDVAVSLGVLRPRSWLVRLLTRLRNWSLGGSCHNVALGEVMAARVQACGICAPQISVINNWSIVPPAPVLPHGEPAELRRRWQLTGQFVVAYSGNLGKAHEIDTLFGAMHKLRNDTGISFVIIGGGQLTRSLTAQVTKAGLGNVQFQPYQPIDQLHQSLAVADAHLVILRPDLEGCIVPSKFYGAAASGRPLIFIGSHSGEVAAILSREQAGITATMGDSESLVAAIVELRDDPARTATLGANARRITDTIYTRERSLAQWSALLSRGGKAQPGRAE